MPNRGFVALGFDFGMKRIGVAVGQIVTCSANAMAILKAKDGIPDWEKIKTLIETWQANVVVVGIPYNMNGSEQPMTFAARKFARKLQSRFGCPAYTVDERLTTIEIQRQWYEQKITKQPQYIDNYAAKLILEQWFQEQNYA